MTRLRRSPRKPAHAFVKIDKSVPIPARTRTPKWPFAALEIGDSFLMPGAKPQSAKSLASAMGTKLGKRFVAHADKGGVRVWRVKK